MSAAGIEDVERVGSRPRHWPAAGAGLLPRLNRARRALASMRFALALLLALAVASVLAVMCGELFPVSGLADPEAYYRDHLSPGTYGAVRALGLLHPYRSFWYGGLLGGLVLSLGACISTRFTLLSRHALRIEPLESPEELAGLPCRASWTSSRFPDAAALATLLRRRRYRARLVDDGAGGFQLAAARHGAGRLGPLLSHAGMLLLFLGGTLVALLSERAYVWLGEGESVLDPGGRYELVLDRFELVTTAEGEVADYLSTVHVLEDGRETARQVVEVNHPLRHGGFSWYQSSYRTREDRVGAVTVRVEADPPATLRLVAGQETSVPGLEGTSLRLEGYVPHYAEAHGRVLSLSPHPVDPAVNIFLLREGEPARSTWIRLADPAGVRGGPVPVEYGLVEVEPALETGLEVRSFPGAPLIWAGFAVMTAGLLLSFLLDHRRLWVFVTPEGGRVRLAGGGDIAHALPTFRREFREITRLLGAPDPAKEG